jgi:GntR family transcriptional repressor for pyruvate dehydrogenase complex
MPLTKGIAPIDRQPVAEQVARQLLALVQAGSLKPGQKLPPERELAATLEVSRPSLREALRALSLLGVLRIKQGGGVYISSLDPESLLAPLHFFISLDAQNLEDLFEARLVIESEIARIAALKISEDDLARLKACVDFEAHELDDEDKFIQSDVEFHKILNESVDNAFLQKFATSLHILGKASREITGHIPGVIEQSLKDHVAIVTAIEARDGDATAVAMKTHLLNVRNAYRGQGS